MRQRHAAWVLALVLVPVIAHAGRTELNFTTNIDDQKSIVSCSDIEMKFWKGSSDGGGFLTLRRDQTVTLSLSGSAALRVRAAERGGIRVQPSADGNATALVCMAAGARTETAANAILERIHVNREKGELKLSGPEDEAWAAYIVLSVPPDVKLDLSALNGELCLRDVSGQFTLRTTNGPIAISQVTGVVDGEAVNGPIKFRGHSGDVRLAAQNGPVKIVLDAAAWTGKGLDARTTNGPVKLSAPSGLRAGVEVAGSSHSPFKWSGISRAPFEEWSRDHSIRLGEGPVVVRLSTVNGPVEITGARDMSKKKEKSETI